MEEEKLKANYLLTIVKVTPNPEFKGEATRFYENNRRFNDDMSANPREVMKNVLMLELSESEFEAFKLEALKSFK